MKQKIILIASLGVIALLAVLVWYSPIIFKGYNVSILDVNALVRARNLANAEINGAENDLNVVLSTDLLKEQGNQSLQGNNLSVFLMAKIIKIFGSFNVLSVILFNCVVLALALIIFGLAVYYLFGYKVFLFFSLIYIFLPSNWFITQSLLSYQFAVLFLAIFFLLFTLGTRGLGKEIKSNFFSLSTIYLIFSGIFLALAGLSKEAFLIFFPILFIFLLFSQNKKRLLYIFIPLTLILIIFWLPNFISGNNVYSFIFKTPSEVENSKAIDYSYYAEFFPDPYTYHFAQESYLQEQLSQGENSDFTKQQAINKQASSVGAMPLDFIGRLKISSILTVRHLFRFMSISETGGPLITLLLIIGLIALKIKRKPWFILFTSWFLGSIILWGGVALVGRNHMMDLGFGLAVCSSLGIILLTDSLSNQLSYQKNKNLITFFILILVIYNLILSNHVMWSQKYNNNPIPLLDSYIEKIKENNIVSNDVIATPTSANEVYYLNYRSNKSFVVFQKETIEKLISENKLGQVFDEFKVKYILGYDPELSKKIVENYNIKNIADNQIPINSFNVKLPNQSWFLNLIK
ncbi:MAG: hypothetical protein WC675_02135 [Patescibacteria group bacterium]|jgi:hypothetical protein